MNCVPKARSCRPNGDYVHSSWPSAHLGRAGWVAPKSLIPSGTSDRTNTRPTLGAGRWPPPGGAKVCEPYPPASITLAVRQAQRLPNGAHRCLRLLRCRVSTSVEDLRGPGARERGDTPTRSSEQLRTSLKYAGSCCSCLKRSPSGTMLRARNGGWTHALPARTRHALLHEGIGQLLLKLPGLDACTLRHHLLVRGVGDGSENGHQVGHVRPRLGVVAAGAAAASM